MGQTRLRGSEHPPASDCQSKFARPAAPVKARAKIDRLLLTPRGSKHRDQTHARRHVRRILGHVGAQLKSH
eukprot:11201578-Lingulodinium_polyedra.AAC.1